MVKALRMTNSQGIQIAHNASDLDRQVRAFATSGMPFLVEEAVLAPTEFVCEWQAA